MIILLWKLLLFRQVLQKKGKHQVFKVSRSVHSLAMSVGRRNRKSVVNQVMKDRNMRSSVVVKVGKLIKKLVFTGTHDARSMYGNKFLEDMKKFDWSLMAADMKKTMPTFYGILEECMKSNKEKKVVVIAFIGKQNNERLSFLQHLFSLLLYSSHCSKQVHVCMTIDGIFDLILALQKTAEGWCVYVP